MPWHRRLPLAILGASLSAYDAEAQIGLGPLNLPSQSPGQSLRPRLLPPSPSPLAAGEREARVQGTWTNMWADEPDYHLDYEQLQAGAGLAWAPTARLRLGAGAAATTLMGGGLDGFIQGFHRAFGLSQDRRTEFPQGDARVDIAATGDQPAIHQDRAALEEETHVFVHADLQYTLTHGGSAWPAVAVGISLQGPVGAQREDYAGAWGDLGCDLALSKRCGPVVAYLSADWTLVGPGRIAGVDARPWSCAGLLALEWQVGDGWSLIAQYLVSQGLLEDYWVFSTASHEVTAGVRVRLDSRTDLALGLIENIIIFDNSPDFGLHAELAQRW